MIKSLGRHYCPVGPWLLSFTKGIKTDFFKFRLSTVEMTNQKGPNINFWHKVNIQRVLFRMLIKLKATVLWKVHYYSPGI